MEPTPGTEPDARSSRRGSWVATTLVTVGFVAIVLAPLVLFLGFAWIRHHHYGDGTGDLGMPFAWMLLDVLLGAALIAVGRSVRGDREPPRHPPPEG